MDGFLEILYWWVLLKSVEKIRLKDCLKYKKQTFYVYNYLGYIDDYFSY